MSSVTVELSGPLREFVEAQAAERGLGDAGDYLIALADEERKRAVKARLEEHLLASLRSGPPIEVTEEYWEEKLRKIDAAEAAQGGREPAVGHQPRGRPRIGPRDRPARLRGRP